MTLPSPVEEAQSAGERGSKIGRVGERTVGSSVCQLSVESGYRGPLRSELLGEWSPASTLTPG